MKLTPEQFNILVTKDDLDEKLEGVAMKKDTDKILAVVDEIKKSFDDQETEKAANKGAHQRIQEDVNEVRGHVGLDIKNPTLEPESA